MIPVSFSPEQTKLLERIEGAGVATQFLLATNQGESIDEYLAHQKTALLVLKKIQADVDHYFDRLLKNKEYKDRCRSDFFQVTIDESKLQGQRITLAEFMGRYYSVERNQIALRGRTENHLNDYFWEGEEELTANKIDIYQEFRGLDLGYVYSFLEPPYALRGTLQEKQAYFRDVERLLFECFDPNATIFQWNNESSSYFDAGKEWWGAYFYTYAMPNTNLVLGIAASETD
ncbi:MAG: hypothetical protein AAGD25_19035 [Cyanobacteria bacterium P01_F01_bin.150]